MKKSIAALALIAALPLAASAGQEIYGGIGLGSSALELAPSIDTTAGGTVNGGKFNGNEMSWKAFGGYQITDAVAVELAYVNLGSFKKNFQDSEGLTVIAAKIEPKALDLTAVGRLPVAKDFNLIGRLGIAYLSGDLKISNGTTYSNDSQNLVLGTGIEWAAIDHFRVRLEATWYDTSNTNYLTDYSLSGIYSFDL